MDLMQIGAQLLQSKLGDSVQTGDIVSALSDLLGGENGFDITGLISKMQGNNGLASLASSWLGDGENAAISASQVTEFLGEGKIAEFASKLNIDEGTAANGLADVLPEMINHGSSAGSLLDSVGGAAGLMGMAGKLFK